MNYERVERVRINVMMKTDNSLHHWSVGYSRNLKVEPKRILSHEKVPFFFVNIFLQKNCFAYRQLKQTSRRQVTELTNNASDDVRERKEKTRKKRERTRRGEERREEEDREERITFPSTTNEVA